MRAFNIFVNIKKKLKENQKFDPSFVFLICLLKITPAIMLKPIKIGGTDYLIPTSITYWKKITYGCRWVIKLLKETNRVLHVDTAVKALLSSLFGYGLSFEKKKKVYMTAILNKHLLKNKMAKR